MKKSIIAEMSGSALNLTTSEKAQLKDTLGQIRLSPQKVEEISQKIQEHQAKRGASQGADRG